MKYKVRCNGCGRQFMIEATDSGRHRYRCPYCDKVVLCQVNVPPAESSRVSSPSSAPTPSLAARTVRTSKAMAQKTQQGAHWFAGRIGRFRSKYENADLWLFFIFSILFIASVIAGLFISAEIAKLITQGKSWLFRLYLDFKHW